MEEQNNLNNVVNKQEEGNGHWPYPPGLPYPPGYVVEDIGDAYWFKYKIPKFPGCEKELALSYLSSLPKCYKFEPTDSELIRHYLIPRIRGQKLDINLIHRVNIYAYEPDQLEDLYKGQNKPWYFFTTRDRKYPNGRRPDRKAGRGYWKATGADIPIMHEGIKIGFRKALVFYQGKPGHGIKTDWLMHEFMVARLDQDNISNIKREDCDEYGNDTRMRLDEYVLCRIYKKEKKKGGPGKTSSKAEQKEEIEDDNNPSDTGYSNNDPGDDEEQANEYDHKDEPTDKNNLEGNKVATYTDVVHIENTRMLDTTRGTDITHPAISTQLTDPKYHHFASNFPGVIKFMDKYIDAQIQLMHRDEAANINRGVQHHTMSNTSNGGQCWESNNNGMYDYNRGNWGSDHYHNNGYQSSGVSCGYNVDNFDGMSSFMDEDTLIMSPPPAQNPYQLPASTQNPYQLPESTIMSSPYFQTQFPWYNNPYNRQN